MTVEEAWAWRFEPELQEKSEVLCPECKEWSDISDWSEGSVFCELCGEHATMVCPKCEEQFDHVGYEIFKTRLKG